MTCIVAFRSQERGLVFGADSEANDGKNVVTLRHPKIWKSGNLILGACGNPRIMQVARQYLPADKNWEQVEDVVEFLESLMEEWGLICTEDCSRHMMGYSEFLVGLKGQLFVIEPNFTVTEREEPYESIGSGRQAALGVFWALFQKGYWDKGLALIALEASEKFCDGVRGPFHFIQEYPSEF